MNYRSFIAVEIPAEIHSAIARSVQELQKGFPRSLVRWVEPENIHLTLKFLGPVFPADLETVAAALKEELATHEPFEMSAGGLGAFPTTRRARVLWVGLQAPPALLKLQRGVEAVAARKGFPPEERAFSPHLTIGRVGQHVTPADLAKIGSAIEKTSVGDLGSVQVEAVIVFKSDLRPSGAIYTPLYNLPMKRTGSTQADH